MTFEPCTSGFLIENHDVVSRRLLVTIVVVPIGTAPAVNYCTGNELQQVHL